MAEIESPAYVIYFSDSLNRATIASAKPDKEIRVLVTTEDTVPSKPIAALGKLDAMSSEFVVTVTTVAGTQVFRWNWNWLLEKLSSYDES